MRDREREIRSDVSIVRERVSPDNPRASVRIVSLILSSYVLQSIPRNEQHRASTTRIVEFNCFSYRLEPARTRLRSLPLDFRRSSTRSRPEPGVRLDISSVLNLHRRFLLLRSAPSSLADRDPLLHRAVLTLHEAAPVKLAAAPLGPSLPYYVVTPAAAQVGTAVAAGAGLVTPATDGAGYVGCRVPFAEVGRLLVIVELLLEVPRLPLTTGVPAAIFPPPLAIGLLPAGAAGP